MLTAIVRPPTDALARCELTYLSREPIDADLAIRQHAAYVEALRDLGARIVQLAPEPDLPDAVFVEDTAIVLDEVAVLTHPGAASRRPEVDSIAAALAPYRTLLRLTAPGTLDGGDVMQVDRALYVGTGGRTSEAGARMLASLVAPYGYTVHLVPIADCLHLKTACTYLGRGLVLANTAWVDPAHFRGCDVLPVPEDEPYAANTLSVAGTTLLPAGAPRTQAIVERHGFPTHVLAMSELQKAEAGVTCQSLIFDA